MGDTLLMTVCKPFHELLKVISGKWLLKSSRNRNEVENLSTFGQFQDDKVDVFFLSAVLLVDSVSSFDLINDVQMFKFVHGFAFDLD